jgi:predicted secreted protein
VLASSSLLAAILLAGCGSSNPSKPTKRTSTTTTTPATTTSPAAGTTTLTDADNGRTVALRVGERLRVVLASTYWELQPSSDPTVLQADGQPVVAPQRNGCVVGQGCGTVTAEFTAHAPGSATVTATRTTCGEALACAPADRRYQVVVTVTAP